MPARQNDAKYQPLFAFASYSCGSGSVAKARKFAAKRGFKPNKWFNNIESAIAGKRMEDPHSVERAHSARDADNGHGVG